MTRTTILNITRILLTLLWRLALTAAVAAGLALLGTALVLNMVFNGPSAAARDQLVLTLMESEKTCAIPGYFLSSEALAEISGGVSAPAGSTDPSLIQASSTGEIQTAEHNGAYYTAQITRFPASSKVQLTAEADAAATGTSVVTGGQVNNSSHFAGITPGGILLLTDDTAGLQDAEAVLCGTILIWDSQVNEAVFTGSSGFAPRAAIGQTADGTVIFISTDGWTLEHWGATCQDIINLMVEQGAVNACLLGREARCERIMLTESGKEG